MKLKESSFTLSSLLFKYKNSIIITFIVAALSSVSSVFSTLFIGKGIDYIAGINNVDYVSLYRVLVLLLALYFTESITTWLVTVFSNNISFSVAKDLRFKVFNKMGRLPLSYFDQTPHGDIISRFTNDINSISDAMSLGLVSLFTGIVTVISVLTLMLILSPKITIVILFVSPINFLVAWIQSKASRNTFSEQQEIIGELSGFVSERVGNQKTINALGYEKESAGQFKKINERLKIVGTRAQFAAAVVNPTTRVVDHVSYILVGIVGGFIALTSQNITIGMVSTFLMYSGQFSKPFNEISGIMANLQTAMAALRRISQTLNEREEIPDRDNAKSIENPTGNVDFKNVDFSYNKSQPLIQNLNITAKQGELVAIVGPTGGGKTTIVNLLMRFYELDSGAISIDENNIINLTKDSIRRSFGMVLQETWLFHGTIKENISYGRPEASEENVVEAAKFAHAHSFIMNMPKGYDTLIAEDGGNLSQGQKQLLTIARVMLTDPSMLILDEATSSIDTLTEKRVQKAFLKMMKGRTSFVIAHRLSTIVQADLILVLDKGRVIETGNHKELIEKKGFYYKLYQSQFE